jgi:hypothetical protein
MKKIIATCLIVIFLVSTLASANTIEKQNKQDLNDISINSLPGSIIGYIYSDSSFGPNKPLPGVEVKLRGIHVPPWGLEDLDLTTNTDETGFFGFFIEDEYFYGEYHIETENFGFFEGRPYAKIYKFFTIDDEDHNNQIKNLGTIFIPEGYDHNIAPSVPAINGPARVLQGKKCQYTFSATDEEGDKLEYNVRVIDDNGATHYVWSHPLCDNNDEGYASGEETQTFSFEFNSIVGTKEIRVYVRDSKGALSECGVLPVSFSKGKSILFNSDFFTQILKMLPLLQQFLNF